MNEKEAVLQAKENLKASWKVVRRDLKIYNKAVLNRNKAVLKNVGNDIIGLFNRLSEKANIYRLEKERERLAKKQIKIEEQIKESNLRIQKQEEKERLKAEEKQRKQQIKEDKKERRQERFLNFKTGVKQKASSLKSRFGKVKNSVLNGLSFSNINAKLRNAFDHIQLFGIKTASGIVKGANIVKDNVSNFTSDQIAKYHLNRMRRQEVREEKKRERDIRRAEITEEINEMNRIKERTYDHKIGMMEALAEQYKNSDVQSEIALDVQKIMDENKGKKEVQSKDELNLNPNKKQKVNSSSSRLGRIKNSMLFNLRLTNIGSKLRNAFDNVQLFGINMARGSVKGMNAAKEGIANFTSEQIAKYSEWRIKREVEKIQNSELRAIKKEEKAHNARLKEAEKLSQTVIDERTRDHKAGMMQALNDQERELYDAKHEEFLKQRQELIQSLIEENNRLISQRLKKK